MSGPSFTLSDLPANGTLYATHPLSGPHRRSGASRDRLPSGRLGYDDYLGAWTKTFFSMPTANWSGTRRSTIW